MAKYFTLMHGLRGCYMPNEKPQVIMVKTRRALKEAIANEADMLRTDETIGLSKKAIASLAASCWHAATFLKPSPTLPFCLPMKERGQSSYGYGIFCAVTTRREYLEYLKIEER